MLQGLEHCGIDSNPRYIQAQPYLSNRIVQSHPISLLILTRFERDDTWLVGWLGLVAHWNTDKEPPRWSIENHKRAPKAVKDVVLTITMARSIALWSSISLLPNEILFLIFEHLDYETILDVARDQSRRQHQSRSHDLVNDEEEKEPTCHIM